MKPAFDNVDEEIKQIRLEAWHKAPGPEDLEVTEGTALGSLVCVRGVRGIAHAVFTVIDAVFVIGKNVHAEHGGLVRRGAMVHGSDQAVT